MESQQTTKKVVFGILQFLDEELKKNTSSEEQKEGLEVAMQCLETAFGVGLQDTDFRPKKGLRELVANLDEIGGTGDAPGGAAGGEPLSSSFPGTAQLSGAGNPLLGTSYVNTGPEYVKPGKASDSDKEAADELKNKGNEAMKQLQFLEGLNYYNKAIALDGNNPVFFCNRSAAYMKLEQYEEALKDCQVAVQLHPTYAKAFGRMGLVYSSQNKHVDAILCYRKALEMDPDNDSYKKNLQVAQHMMIQDIPTAQAQAATSPNLDAFFRNPNLTNLASQMLQNPNMQNLLQTTMQYFQNSAAGAGGGGGGMDSLLQIGQAIAQRFENSDQNLVEQLTGLGINGADAGQQQPQPSNAKPGPNNDPASDDPSN